MAGLRRRCRIHGSDVADAGQVAEVEGAATRVTGAKIEGVLIALWLLDKVREVLSHITHTSPLGHLHTALAPRHMARQRAQLGDSQPHTRTACLGGAHRIAVGQ